MVNRSSFRDTHSKEKSSEPAKKRGRPSKEAVEQRDKELAAKGEVYRPSKRKPRKPDALAGSPLLPLTLPESSASSTSAAPQLETPLRQTFDVKEENSSGKRKRRRTRDDNQEAEQAPISAPTRDEPSNTGSMIPAQSPSDRLLARGVERESAVAQQARDVGDNEKHTDAHGNSRDGRAEGPRSNLRGD